MGQAALKRSATQRFIQEYPECCFCGGRSATRDHMPPKSLFDRSYRPDKLVMPACAVCNKGTSTADLTVAIVSRWNYLSSEQEDLDHSKLARRIRSQAPELFAEWTQHNLLGRIKGRRHLIEQGVPVPPDAAIVTIGSHTIRQLNLFAHKAVLALYFEHFRQRLPNTGAYCAFWRSKEDYVAEGMPQRLLDMLPAYGTLVQGSWDESETFEYRHAINFSEGILGFFARLRRGLFISGFAVSSDSHVPTDDTDWVRPGDLLGLMDTPRFQKKR